MQKKLHIVLHAHIPYVLYTDMEYWLHEAVLHSYLPLLRLLRNHQHTPITLILNLSPILLVQLSDPQFCPRFQEYLELIQQILSLDLENSEKNKVLESDLKDFLQLKKIYEEWNGDLIKAFSYYAELGRINIITSTATHTYLPAFIQFPKIIQTQIVLGKKISEYFFPKIEGFWVPECGIYPNLSSYLDEYQIKYTFADPSSIKNNDRIQHYIDNNIHYFCRDYECTSKIWHPDTGYPGHSVYREFYKDLKEECSSVRSLLSRYRIPMSGISLYAVTDKATRQKQIYNHHRALEQIQLDTTDYINYLNQQFNNKNHIVICFDAELFGHWWKDGVKFLDVLFNKVGDINISPIDFSIDIPFIKPSLSSWGKGYNSESWINPKTQKVWEHLIKESYHIEQQLVKSSVNPDDLYYFLLSQASDWTFLITYDTFTQHATHMIKNTNSFFEPTQYQQNLLYQSIYQNY
ncbi:MAG: hypothetical protein ACRCWI_08515 [Brevinema sp.]